MYRTQMVRSAATHLCWDFARQSRSDATMWRPWRSVGNAMRLTHREISTGATASGSPVCSSTLNSVWSFITSGGFSRLGGVDHAEGNTADANAATRHDHYCLETGDDA